KIHLLSTGASLGDLDFWSSSIRSTDKPPRLAPAERRWIFDSSRPGKSNQGHDFGKGLADAQASDLLEYLKTL
ncbi:MAG: hypothetical protein ACKN81_15945, partial [Pirellulaceae bacterium]